jgi:hypothetical protein
MTGQPTVRSLFAIPLFLWIGLSACTHPNEVVEPAERPPLPAVVEVDGGSIRLIGIALQASYQTSYLMSYPSPGAVFVKVTLETSGLDEPEAVLQRLVTIRSRDEELHASHVRRRLSGGEFAYRAGEDFQFVYQLFFEIERNFDPDSAALLIDGDAVGRLGTWLQGDLDTQLVPTISPVPGTVLSGSGNQAGGLSSVVAGGSGNQTAATHTTVSGGQLNTAAAAHATVAGGRENVANSFFASVGGGFANQAIGRESTVSGGSRSTAAGRFAAIGGGIQNQAQAASSNVAGGAYNIADGVYSAIAGGTRNQATGNAVAIGGGAGNLAAGDQAGVLGGLANRATGAYSTVGGGLENEAAGRFSTVPGGSGNRAAADFSLAAGRMARVAAEHTGTILLADSTDLPFASAAADELAVRASGGVRLITSVDGAGMPLAGATLAPGSGSWSMLSDRESKTAFSDIDPAAILNALTSLPISRWRYRAQDSTVFHLGPTAQDFAESFSLGEDQEHISAVDADGVALAAIQGLATQVRDQQAQLDEQSRRLARIEGELDDQAKCDGMLSGGRLLPLALVAILGGLIGQASRQSDRRDQGRHDAN